MRRRSPLLFALALAACQPEPTFEPALEPLVGTIVSEAIIHPGDPPRRAQLTATAGTTLPGLPAGAPGPVAVRLVKGIPAVPVSVQGHDFAPAWAVQLAPDGPPLTEPVSLRASEWMDPPGAPAGQLLFAAHAGDRWQPAGAPVPVDPLRRVDARLLLDRPGLWAVATLTQAPP
jgi:hypothetical protein